MGEIDPRAGGTPRFGDAKVLFFDVFGTTVDWRSSVTAELIKRGHDKARSPDVVSAHLEGRLEELNVDNWAKFAQKWRNSYGSFVKAFVPGRTEPKDIDTHHHDSLIELLHAWEIKDAFSDAEIRDLSLVWHRLKPWPDSPQGLTLLNSRYETSTLSNGNVELLRDLQEYGSLGFKHLVSSWMFKAYKPHPTVYLGAAEKLGFQPKECVLVAAHLGDLRAAKNQGFRVVYIERPQEEELPKEAVLEARQWVDMWVDEGEGGFVEVAKKLGIVPSAQNDY